MTRFFEGFVTGWLALKASKLRSVLTMLGIVIGTGGVIGTMSFGEGARRLVLFEVEKMGGTSTFNVSRPEWVQRDGRWQRNPSNQYLTMRDVYRIEELCPSVEYVTPEMGTDADLDAAGESKRASLRGTTSAYQSIRDWTEDMGRFLVDMDVSLWSKVVVIGSEVAEDLFGFLDPVGEELRINNQRYTVVGVMESMGGGNSPAGSLDNQVFIPVTTAQSQLSGNDKVPSLLLKARTPELRERAQDEVRAILSRYHPGDNGFEVYSQASQMATEANLIGTAIKAVLGLIAGMSLVVGGIGILNIMFVTVTERTHEIGIRKAVGASRFDIATQFLIEAFLLCLVGSAIGVFFGWLTERALAFAVIKFIVKEGEWPSFLSWFSVMLSVGAGSLTGILAGMAPAIRAALLPPIEALRHQ
ncbi:FtsX-like permease family protein [Candidatus Poribacteria bacterium]|nr:FtsX-like permease family protein [Candidatus Poribacteria bacterium]